MRKPFVFYAALPLLLLALAALALGSGRVGAATPLLRLLPGADGGDGLLRVEIHAQDAADLAAWEADLRYDPARLALLSLESAAPFGRVDGCDPGVRCALLLGPKPVLGGSGIGALSWGGGGGLNGDGLLAVLTFQPLTGEGSVALSLANPLLANSQGQTVTPQSEGVTVVLGQTANHSLFLPAVTNH